MNGPILPASVLEESFLCGAGFVRFFKNLFMDQKGPDLPSNAWGQYFSGHSHSPVGAIKCCLSIPDKCLLLHFKNLLLHLKVLKC